MVGRFAFQETPLETENSLWRRRVDTNTCNALVHFDQFLHGESTHRMSDKNWPLRQAVNECRQTLDDLSEGQGTQVLVNVGSQLRGLAVVKRVCRRITGVTFCFKILFPTRPTVWILEKTMNKDDCARCDLGIPALSDFLLDYSTNHG